MAGKQAKTLNNSNVTVMLRYVAKHRYPLRDRVIILLSIKAGLRAHEIANLTWPMVLDARGRIGPSIELHDCAAKRQSGRSIPLHPQIRQALIKLRQVSAATDADSGHVITSERGGKMTANSVINWFACLYRCLGLQGCSSHSGRRTFITNAARNVHRAGGSIRDVQQLAGHRSIAMTQRYIDGDTAVKRRLVALL
jgi:integrase/recombinase XerD